MRIQTTEAVRRFNAQTELVDIALEYAADEITDPGRLFALLCLAGHRELKDTFEESMRQACIVGSGWPDARPTAPDPSRSPHTVSEGSTKSPIDSVLYACRIVKDFLADERTQYLLNASGSRTSEYSRAFLEIVGAIALLEKTHNWREFCQNSARPGDVANVILERDEMRTTLKQCRQALSVALCGTPSEYYFEHVKEVFKITDHKTIEDNLAANTRDIKRLAEAALNRINSIIPASEV